MKMHAADLWEVGITTTDEASEAASEALTSEFGLFATSYTDTETYQARVCIYLDQPPECFSANGFNIRRRLEAAQDAGLEIAPGKIELRKIKRENWAESWKRHFKPLRIGGKLLLKPSWSQCKTKPGQKVIVLDPGLSFGTGHHPTTSFCLREVVRFASRGGGSFLDVGTGSGVLAIAATKLGCTPVEAFDFDPEAVRVARENARRNRVETKLHLKRGDVTKLARKPHRRFDLVCANLISNLLIAERERILARVKPGGTLVLAGILRTEFSEVAGVFEANGLKLVRRRDEKEWASGAFVRKAAADQ